jgi:hypothetical protein
MGKNGVGLELTISFLATVEKNSSSSRLTLASVFPPSSPVIKLPGFPPERPTGCRAPGGRAGR